MQSYRANSGDRGYKEAMIYKSQWEFGHDIRFTPLHFKWLWILNDHRESGFGSSSKEVNILLILLNTVLSLMNNYTGTKE